MPYQFACILIIKGMIPSDIPDSGHDSPRFIPFYLVGKIGVNRDGKDENPASIRCLTMLLRCLQDSSTVTLRLMPSALRFIPVELRMLKNAYDVATIRYGATVQAGSATAASRSPTNVHDLAVVMRQVNRDVSDTPIHPNAQEWPRFHPRCHQD